MAANSQRPIDRDGVVSKLNLAIEGLNLAKEISLIAPAKAAFGSVSILLTMIKDFMANEEGYVGLGLDCADICTALDRGTNGKEMDDLRQSVREAINQLTTMVADIQGRVTKQSQRGRVSRFLHARNDKEKIACWKAELNKILQVFQTELAINTHVVLSDTQNTVTDTHNTVVDTQNTVVDTHNTLVDTHNTVTDTHNIMSDIHRALMKGQEGTNDDSRPVPDQTRVRGELPPPPPRAFFGRDELVDKVIAFAGNLEPVALVGAGGIGKTSIALAVLHDDRIKKRFQDDRRFIRCDQFPASRLHLLSRLSKVIGAGIENPEDLAPLRPFLFSREMILFLDNVESILDPQGTDSREIYVIVEELSRFPNICLGITSRISTVPPRFKRPVIPTLSMESASDIFYSIYEDGGRSDVINGLVKQLDFHALSITLLATTASHNIWDYDRLAREWDTQRSQILRTDFNESLAATIELSLASPTFRKLGPDARNLLEVVAFFPQGVDENNLTWLFPAIPGRRDIFGKFCVLSLAFRSNTFVTMLAPIRDYLRPQDPGHSPLLVATKDNYFSQLPKDIDPGGPGFEEGRWIVSEDVNIEYLLDVFTSIDMNSEVVWDVCINFIRHLLWHKRRYTMLGPKIEGLPDEHPSKPVGLTELSLLYGAVGNYAEKKRLLIHVLKLYRERKDDCSIATTLGDLSDTNNGLGLYEEGIEQAKEASEILERLGDTIAQADCLDSLARLLVSDKQLDAAEEAATRAIKLLPEKGQEYLLCQVHGTLGDINRSNNKREEAIYHFGVVVEIASAFKWHGELFWNHYALAHLFYDEYAFDDAHSHVEQAKSHAEGDEYHLGRAMEMKARIWHRQRRLEDAASEVLGALEIYEKLGASKDVGDCKELLQEMEEAVAGAARGPPSSALQDVG